jgi:hypothetical protein
MSLDVRQKMYRAILKFLQHESWDCNTRYGVSPESLLMSALQLTPEGGLLEVSDQDVGVLPVEYSRSPHHKGVVSSEGESFRVSSDFLARYCDDLKNARVTIPDTYCLIESDTILLAVVNRCQIIDFSKQFLKKLETRLTRVS